MSTPEHSGHDSDYQSVSESELDNVPRGIVPVTGQRFHVPETVSVMRSLVHWRSLQSPLTLLWILTCLLTEGTFLLWLRGSLGSAFFVTQFLLWRLGYNLGLGLILHHQSKSLAFERWFERTMATAPKWVVAAFRKCVVFRDGKSTYHEKDFPNAFNAWMLFRFVVNVILANDLLAYFLVVAVEWAPPDFTSIVDIACYVTGLSLIVFAIWSKSDAHRIIGDFAWYWGDFFFLLDKHLVFDSIFEMFPHPMYTVGYAFMYGFTLMAKSYTVFYASLAGHVMQLIFLAIVENPHIDKTYNVIREPTDEEKQRDDILYDDEHGYFERKELIALRNFNFHRATDILLALLIAYTIAMGFVSWYVGAWVVIVQAIFWRLTLNVGLGSILWQEASTHRWSQRYFRSPREAFDNWKRLYNTVVTVTNVSYVVAAVRLFQWDSPFTGSVDSRMASIIIGLLCVALQVYVALGVYEAIGDFGYFYGDFFITEIPTKLCYTGIYRYLNNPDGSLGFAGYYGLALCSGSYEALLLAVVSHVAAKLFERAIERPHAEATYGGKIRKAGGLRRTLRSKADGFRDTLQRKQKEAKEEYERGIQQLKDQLAKRKLDYERVVDRFNRAASKDRRDSGAAGTASKKQS